MEVTGESRTVRRDVQGGNHGGSRREWQSRSETYRRIVTVKSRSQREEIGFLGGRKKDLVR